MTALSLAVFNSSTYVDELVHNFKSEQLESLVVVADRLPSNNRNKNSKLVNIHDVSIQWASTDVTLLMSAYIFLYSNVTFVAVLL